jgi:hypothetical protein
MDTITEVRIDERERYKYIHRVTKRGARAKRANGNEGHVPWNEYNVLNKGGESDN